MTIKTKYVYRYLARVIVEAVTPLAVGSGERSILSDSLVALDANGLPYIPGTALAGVLRHLSDGDLEDLFGYQSGKEGCGSKIIFSEARMIGHEGKVLDGLVCVDWSNSFYAHFRELPIRQHVRMGHKGTAVKGGKFDEQVVYKGTRFCFEIEMVSEEESVSLFNSLLVKMFTSSFRLGGGLSKGFGEMKVVDCKTKILKLSEKADLDFYLSKSSSLACDWEGDYFSPESVSSDLIRYRVELIPEDLFLFGSGLGDAEADITPVREEVVVWDEDGLPAFSEQLVLIPASSVKGALSHRTAFYWNKLNKHFAENILENELYVGDNNPAVLALFGSENPEFPQRGAVFFSDMFGENSGKDKLINHVAIDQFTSGAIEGALFSEKVIEGNHMRFSLKVDVRSEAYGERLVQEAFELALKDLCSGYLPLGGGVNRGNGCFYGTLWRNDECILGKEAWV